MVNKENTWHPLVYICSPYSGDTERNTANAIRYSRFAVDSGAIPLAPHLLLPQYMRESDERNLAILMDLEILGRCDEMWVFGRLRSKGMEIEIAEAKERSIPIRYFTEDIMEVT